MRRWGRPIRYPDVMPAARPLAFILFSAAALLLEPLAVEAAPARGEPTRADGGRKRVRRGRKAPRVRPKVQRSVKRRVLPPGRESANDNSPPPPGHPFAAFGSKVAAKKAVLLPNQLVDGNVALLASGAAIVPLALPFPGPPEGQKPVIVVKELLHILYPMGQLPGTDLRVKCEGWFAGDVEITVGDGGWQSNVFENLTINKKTNGKVRKTLTFIIETDDIPANSPLFIDIHPTVDPAFFNKCLVEQLDD